MRSVVLPFKDQASADIVRVQLKDFSQKIYTTEQPVCQPEDRTRSQVTRSKAIGCEATVPCL